MKYLIVTLAFVMCSAFAQSPKGHINLDGGNVIAEPKQCMAGKNAGLCLLVEKDAKVYLVVLDEQGEFEIYSVQVVRTETGMTLKGVTLIWSRRNTV